MVGGGIKKSLACRNKRLVKGLCHGRWLHDYCPISNATAYQGQKEQSFVGETEQEVHRLQPEAERQKPGQQQGLSHHGNCQRRQHHEPADSLAERLERPLLRKRVGQPDADGAEDEVDDAGVNGTRRDRSGVAVLELL